MMAQLCIIPICDPGDLTAQRLWESGNSLRLAISGFILELFVESRYWNAGRIWNLPDLKPAKIPRTGDRISFFGTTGNVLEVGTDFILQATNLCHGWHA